MLLINFIYKEGPDPVPIENAFIDSDDQINILDIVRLINYIYKEGDTPICP